MPEEPDWDEMAMMEAEAASFAADYQEPPSDIPAHDAPQPAEPDQRKRAPPAEEDSLFDDFDAPVVQPEPVSKRPRTADKPSRQYVFRVAPLGGVVTITNDAGDQATPVAIPLTDWAPPTLSVSGLAFTDTDPDAGEIAGTLRGVFGEYRDDT